MLRLKNLRQTLARLDIEHQTLAAAIGVTPETISRWCQLHTWVRSDNLEAVVEFLQTHDPSIVVGDLMDDAKGDGHE